MVASSFDSFDASGFDVFIESSHGARQGGVAERLLVWPNSSSDSLKSILAIFLDRELSPQWDTHDTWTGNVGDYRAIICDAYAHDAAFWDTVSAPAWYGAVAAGTWTGRIQLGGIRNRNAATGRTEQRAAPTRDFMNPLAEPFGMTITAEVAVDTTYPKNASPPAGDHPLTEGVTLVGHQNNLAASGNMGTAVVGGDATSLADTVGQSFVRERTRAFSNGHRISMVVAGDRLGTNLDPGVTPDWTASSERLARNFWEVPV